MKRIYTLNNMPPEASTSEYRGVNWNHYFSKAFDQLKGICAGILCDGIVTDEEAQYVRKWVSQNAMVQQVWPFDDIARRIEAIFADGIVTDEERTELTDIMNEIVGGRSVPSPGNSEAPLEMALTKPIPNPIIILGSEFSLTGKFATGSRSAVVAKLEERGGSFNAIPRHSTTYLVIGTFGSVNWKLSSYGNKIEKAAEARKAGSQISIILEESLIPFIA